MSEKELSPKKTWAEPELFIISRNDVNSGNHAAFKESTVVQTNASFTAGGNNVRVFFHSGGNNGFTIVNTFGTPAQSWFQHHS